MASISSERKIVTQITDESVTMSINYPNSDGSGNYFHILTGWDTTQVGTPEEPAHQLGVVSHSLLHELPESMIPDGMTVVATFDREPTREELDSFIPDNYRHDAQGDKK